MGKRAIGCTWGIVAIAGLACGSSRGTEDAAMVAAQVGIVVDEALVVLGDEQQVITLAPQRGRIEIEFPAKATMTRTAVTVRAEQGIVGRQGPSPASDLILHVATRGLRFDLPAALRQLLPPAPPGRSYVAVSSPSTGDTWTAGPAARPSQFFAKIDAGASDPASSVWEIEVTGSGLWAIALSEAPATQDAAVPDSAPQTTDAITPTGVDATPDAGVDGPVPDMAPQADAITPTHIDAGPDAGVDAPVSPDAPEDVPLDAPSVVDSFATSDVGASGVGSPFPIATFPSSPTVEDTKAGYESAVGVAFDGTNYLVGIQGDDVSHTHITAQLVSPTGTLIGPRILCNTRSGGVPSVGFTGANYLLAWEDEASGGIYGQLLSTAGDAVTQPFAVNTTAPVSGFLQLGRPPLPCNPALQICGVMWHDGGSLALYGRDIQSDGAFYTAEYPVEDPSTTCLTGTVAYPSGTPCVGGTGGVALDSEGNGLAAYDTGGDIRASIHGPTIVKNTFLVAVKSQGGCTETGGAAAAFDGTNYLVAWIDNSDCVATGDVLAQRVDAQGNLVGGPFAVNSISSTHRARFASVAFDGTQYLVGWTDWRNDTNQDGMCDANEGTCDDVYGQYVGTDGALIGSELAIANAAGNQMAGGMIFANGRFLVLVNYSGNVRFDSVAGDVHGVFVTP